MSELAERHTGAAPAPSGPDVPAEQKHQPLPLKALSLVGTLFRNVSAIPLFLVLFVVFAILVPDTFLTPTTWLSLVNGNATVALAALGATVALSAGVFDVSIGTSVGFGAMSAAWMLADNGASPTVAIIVSLLFGLGVGLLNAFLVVVIGIDSFIATLGVSSILTALILAVSAGQQIIGLSVDFTALGGVWAFGLTGTVFVLVIISLIIWYVLQHTPIGRRVYATGGNREAARLAGVRTKAIIAGALVSSALMGTITGILIAANYGLGDPSTGPDYLLPAFAAAFLGSTQFGRGRFNVLGTLLAVFVLAVGVKGLQLVGVSFWVPSLFNGLALVLAVSLTRLRRRSSR